MSYKILAAMLVAVILMTLWAEESKEPALVKVELVADTLVATITIPDSLHLTRQEDFVYLEYEPQPGVELGKTGWSQADYTDEAGYQNYLKQVVLKRQLSLNDTLLQQGLTLKLYVGYQMCFTAYCLAPEEVEIDLLIPGKMEE